MCRWAAWIGSDLLIEDLVCLPEHSLIQQAQAAEECKTATNGDGFGLAWYDRHPEPGQYRDVYPAWADPNLRALSRQVASRLFMAHVRASTGSAISRNNCHPFVVGNWSFMHNGQIGGFDTFRRHADMLIPDALYPFRKGATDSEVLFLLALAEGLSDDPLAALGRALDKLIALSRTHGQGPHARISVAMSDGKRLWAVRTASDSRAPSLYYRRDTERDGWQVVSEPLDQVRGNWRKLADHSAAMFTQDAVEIISLEHVWPNTKKAA